MWTSVLTNPESIRWAFDPDPSLDDISLHEVTLLREGVELLLRIEIAEYPTTPPAKWVSSGYNRIQLLVNFSPVTNLNVTGWSATNVVSVAIDLCSSGYAVAAIGSTTTIRFNCSFIHIAGIEPYKIGFVP